jgi:phosphatidylserine synthase 2
MTASPRSSTDYSFDGTPLIQTRSVETQTDINPKDYIPASVLSQFDLETEAYPWLIQRPWMLSALFMITGLFIYAVSNIEIPFSPTSFVENSRYGYLAAMFFVVFFACLFFPNSLFQRPHPIVWRFLMGHCICYASMLIFVLFQNREDLNNFFGTYFDKNLGKPLPEKNYADDCRLYTPENPHSSFANLTDAFDVYLSAHFVGWFFKMLVVRNFKFAMFLSIFFECLELTFRHWLPNFHECWWDHVLLDIIICNTGGIIAGHYFIKYFRVKRFKWTASTANKQNLLSNFSAFLRPGQMSPRPWHVFSSTRRFWAVIYYVMLMNAVDLSNFFNKFVLWIPSSHFILTYRIFLWGFLSMVATKEYYTYITDPRCNRMGPFLWIGHFLIFMEGLLFWKFSKAEMFTAPFPFWVKFAWTMVFLMIGSITAVLIKRDVYKHLLNKRIMISRKESVEESEEHAKLD